MANVVGYTRIFRGELSGSDFFFGYEHFFVAPIAVGGKFVMNSLYAMDKWGDEMPIFERLASGGYVAFNGAADVPIRKSDTSLSVNFAGSFSYCALATVHPTVADAAPSCPKSIDCQSRTHTLTVTRR